MSSYIVNTKENEEEMDVLENPLVKESTQGALSILELDRQYSDSEMNTELKFSYCGNYMNQVKKEEILWVIEREF